MVAGTPPPSKEGLKNVTFLVRASFVGAMLKEEGRKNDIQQQPLTLKNCLSRKAGEQISETISDVKGIALGVRGLKPC